MPHTRSLLVFVPLLLLAACQKAPAPTPQPDRAQLIEQRKDVVVSQLADCESGQGGGGHYIGRFQFEPRTVVAYVKERDGRTISIQEAVALANDYGQASSLAKYMIFERDAHTQWPACSRKIGLAQQVADIRSL
jgi:hypothetical protein